MSAGQAESWKKIRKLMANANLMFFCCYFLLVFSQIVMASYGLYTFIDEQHKMGMTRTIKLKGTKLCSKGLAINHKKAWIESVEWWRSRIPENVAKNGEDCPNLFNVIGLLGLPLKWAFAQLFCRVLLVGKLLESFLRYGVSF